MIALNKKILILILILPLLATLIAFLIIHKPAVDLLNSDAVETYPFKDEMSFANVENEENATRLDFKLSKSFTYPFAGIGFHKKDHSDFDLDGYVLNLKLKSSEDLCLCLRLQKSLDNEGYRNANAIITKPFLAQVSASPDVSILMSEVNTIPDWWFAQNPEVDKELKINDLNGVTHFWVMTDGCSTPHEHSFSLWFESAKLCYDYSNFIFWSAILLSIYYVGFALFMLVRKIKSNTERKKEKEVVYMRVEKTDIVNEKEDLKNRLLDYIGHNYHNPDLKLNDVAQSLYITEEKALDILKSAVSMNFRSYLNALRIEEAKRLLRESEYQILEIAYKVGYNNVQHFNRVFKEATGDNPRAFRENSKDE